MTNDQRQALKSIGLFVAFKIILLAAITYTNKASQEAFDKYEKSEEKTSQFSVKTGTDVLGGHTKVDFEKNPD